jgi:hypothetical protein
VTEKKETLPGRFFEMGDDGEMTDLGPTFREGAQLWICRRVRDHPRIPADAGICACRSCGCAIVFDPKRLFDIQAPKVCMQCAGITPLPF